MFRSMETNIRSPGSPRFASARAVKRIITSGPQNHRDRRGGVDRHFVEKRGHDADRTDPVCLRVVHSDVDTPVEFLLPARDLLSIDEVRRAARPVEESDVAEAPPLANELVDDRPERSDPESPCDHDHVLAEGLVDRPSRSVRAANADRVASLEALHRGRDAADRADRMDQRVRLVGVAADEIATSPTPKRYEHIELTGGERESPLRDVEPERECVGGFLASAQDSDRLGQTGVGVGRDGSVHGA